MVTTLAQTRPSDEQLAREAAREGSDGPAFTELVSRFRERVWRVCYRIMGNTEDASDAAQEVLVRMFLQRDRFEQRSQYSTWVHGIAIRTCLSMRRGAQRRRRRVDVHPHLDLNNQPPAPAAGQAADSPAADRRMDLDRMLDYLGDEDRALLVMKYAEDHTYEELSQIFAMSQSACKMRINRAMSRLREKFGR